MPTDNDYLKSYSDFLKDSSTLEDIEDAVETLLYWFYEQEAEALEIPVDYYVQEFVLSQS